MSTGQICETKAPDREPPKTNHDSRKEHPFNEKHNNQMSETVVVTCGRVKGSRSWKEFEISRRTKRTKSSSQTGSFFVIESLPFLDPVGNGSRSETGNHEHVRETLGALGVVAAGIFAEVEKGTTKEDGGHGTGDETRSRQDRVADVDDDLTPEELPELDVEGCLLVKTHLVQNARVGVGPLNDLVDRPLARVDGFNLFLQDGAFCAAFPGLDETIGLGSEGVGVDFGCRGRIRSSQILASDPVNQCFASKTDQDCLQQGFRDPQNRG